MDARKALTDQLSGWPLLLYLCLCLGDSVPVSLHPPVSLSVRLSVWGGGCCVLPWYLVGCISGLSRLQGRMYGNAVPVWLRVVVMLAIYHLERAALLCFHQPKDPTNLHRLIASRMASDARRPVAVLKVKKGNI